MLVYLRVELTILFLICEFFLICYLTIDIVILNFNNFYARYVIVFVIKFVVVGYLKCITKYSRFVSKLNSSKTHFSYKKVYKAFFLL